MTGATNRPDILDQALLWPGRFDRPITLHRPSASDRTEILRIHARDKPLARDVDLDELARGTPELSGADLENLVNEAALIAALRDEAVQEVVESSYARAVDTLEEHRDVLDEVAEMLLEGEEIEGAEVVALLDRDARTEEGGNDV